MINVFQYRFSTTKKMQNVQKKDGKIDAQEQLHFFT